VSRSVPWAVPWTPPASLANPAHMFVHASALSPQCAEPPEFGVSEDAVLVQLSQVPERLRRVARGRDRGRRAGTPRPREVLRWERPQQSSAPPSVRPDGW
jgi:hypothetical protein